MIIEVDKINETYVIVKCEKAIVQELSTYFSFFVEGYRFTPAYKNKIWDGKIRLFKILPNGSGQFYLGLMTQLEAFCKDREYLLVKNYEEDKNKVTREELHEFIDKLNIHTKKQKITVRDYQFDGVLNFLNNKRMVLLSPTASGKSLILYIIIRYLLSIGCKNTLLLVPNTSLLYQLFSDFEDYSSETNWNPENYIHLISAGKDKDDNKPIKISTWQSLQTNSMKNRKKKAEQQGMTISSATEYFKQFDAVLVDECHLSSSTEIAGILEKCVNAKYRIGVSGTLNGSKIHSLQMESHFGQIIKVTTTKELINSGEVSNLAIKCLVLKYPQEIAKLTKKLSYQDEIGFLISNKERNNFIKNLALSMKGNTLVLFNYVETHGQILYDLITNSKFAKDKIVYFIHGNIKAEEREEIRKSMEFNDNVILIGSVGTVATGTNIKNLHHIIFTSPSKSRVRTLQAIGRILRLNKNKSIATLYDIADDLRVGKHQNYTILHFLERVKIYDSEKFDYRIIKIDMKDTNI